MIDPGHVAQQPFVERSDGSLAHAPGFMLAAERRSSSWV
jgi:hypothetical protein